MNRWAVRMGIAAMLGAALSVSGRALADGIMGMESGDLRIATDSTDYDIGTGDFTMPHHVSATRPGTQIDGDSARGNGKNKVVTLSGHVVVHHTGGSTDDSPLGSTGSSEPSTLTTDQLTIELTPKRYTAQGHVHFEQGTRTAVADRAVLDDLSHDLHLSGNVHLTDKGQTLEAQTLDYNTQTEHVRADRDVRIIVPIATASPAAGPVPGASPGPRRHRR